MLSELQRPEGIFSSFFVNYGSKIEKLCFSGKSLAFGIPALCHLLVSSKPKSNTSSVSVLVVAPTRELALQTHDILFALGKPFGITSVAVFGGVPKEHQVKMLKNANKAKDGLITRIIVGTPGRILDLMQEGACDLSG